jgi:hypothetical protein
MATSQKSDAFLAKHLENALEGKPHGDKSGKVDKESRSS